MRLGSYIVERHGHTSEVTIIALPGNSGSLLANINRWRRQIQLAPITEDEIHTVTQLITVRDRDFYFVKLHGPTQSIEAALFKLKDSTVFVKHMADRHTVEEESLIFEGFVRGLRFD
jgi:hypothetical protein